MQTGVLPTSAHEALFRQLPAGQEHAAVDRGPLGPVGTALHVEPLGQGLGLHGLGELSGASQMLPNQPTGQLHWALSSGPPATEATRTHAPVCRQGWVAHALGTISQRLPDARPRQRQLPLLALLTQAPPFRQVVLWQKSCAHGGDRPAKHSQSGRVWQ